MRAHGIRAVAGRRFRPCTTDSRHGLAVAPTLLAQRFEASAPNRVWLADIACIPTGKGWLHLAAVLDLATRKIVGWAMRDHLRTERALAALILAAQRQRPGKGLIHHSDRGRQCAAEGLGQTARSDGCDRLHAPEGPLLPQRANGELLHTLKVKLVHHRHRTTSEQAKRNLFAHIEGDYNRTRIHSALGSLTPDQAEQNAS
jgi:transposase InsO family protein